MKNSCIFVLYNPCLRLAIIEQQIMVLGRCCIHIRSRNERVTGLKINDDPRIIGIAFRFTFPATHTLIRGTV